VSTLDLFGRNFVLLAGPQGQGWYTAVLDAAQHVGVALDAYQVGGGELTDADDTFTGSYGISPAGAVVVRPDGFVAWRAFDATASSTETMARVLSALLCLESGI
jgi:putative polyketide hydroxylase